MKMNFNKFKLVTLLLTCLGLTRLYAQESIPATGDNGTGSGGSVSYTVGQTVYTTNTGTNGSVAKGVQQTFEISVENRIEEAIGIPLQCSVYPNPTINYITLKIENYQVDNLSFKLYDLSGKTIIK
jgi:hypothetical protein